MEIVGVVAVLAAFAAGAHFLKRAGRFAPKEKRLTVEQRLSIANGCLLVLVRHGNEELLLATSASGCTLLSTHVDAAPPPAMVAIRQERRACAG